MYIAMGCLDVWVCARLCWHVVLLDRVVVHHSSSLIIFLEWRSRRRADVRWIDEKYHLPHILFFGSTIEWPVPFVSMLKGDIYIPVYIYIEYIYHSRITVASHTHTHTHVVWYFQRIRPPPPVELMPQVRRRVGNGLVLLLAWPRRWKHPRKSRSSIYR